MELFPAPDSKVSYKRSRGLSRLYHLGKGLENFGAQARRFRTGALSTGAILGIAGAVLSFVAAPFALPVAVMALSVVAGVPAGIAAGFGGAQLKAWAYDHRTALHEKPAEGWRKTGVALATAIACVPGAYAGYHVYKDSPAAEAARDSLKNAFDHGVHEKSPPAQTHSVTLPAPPQRTLVLR